MDSSEEEKGVSRADFKQVNSGLPLSEVGRDVLMAPLLELFSPLVGALGERAPRALRIYETASGFESMAPGKMRALKIAIFNPGGPNPS